MPNAIYENLSIFSDSHAKWKAVLILDWLRVLIDSFFSEISFGTRQLQTDTLFGSL